MKILAKSPSYVFTLIIAFTLFLTGYETSDATLRKDGHSEAYS